VLVGAIVAVKLALHLVVLAVTQFGIQRDEFLYLAMGRHLRFWRMDFPPLMAVLGNLSGALFGHSLAVVRIFPAIEGSLVLLMAALIARELGGGWFAQGLAALSVLSGTLFQRSATLFQPVVLDQLWWTLALYALIRLGREQRKRDWVLFGLGVGFGLLNKFSVLFFGFSVLVAMLVTPAGAWLKTRGPWLAAGLALVIGSPSIAGQIALGFPVVPQMQNLQGEQLTHVTWSLFLFEQPLLLGPAPFLLAAAGAATLIRRREWRPYGVVGWACIVAFVLLFLLHGKSYYIGPIYPTLFGAGAVVLEGWRRPWWAVTVRQATVAGTVVFGLLVLPIGMPILGPQATASYARAIGATHALVTNRGVMDQLPQDYADMLGWEEQSQAVARVVATLTPAEREQAVIFAANYGEAGAAEFYRPRYGLPPVVCASGSYWFFGPGERPGTILVGLGLDSADLAEAYRDVHPAGLIESPWSVDEERRVPIMVARSPRRTLQEMWPRLAGRN
jgi:4-amino-4-deoxy-L-arabinose transferase-like glycosyltransferase